MQNSFVELNGRDRAERCWMKEPSGNCLDRWTNCNLRILSRRESSRRAMTGLFWLSGKSASGKS